MPVRASQRLHDGIAVVGFHAIRNLESLLSPDLLYWLLLPLASARAAIQSNRESPGYFRNAGCRRAARQALTTYFLSRALEFFPERLGQSKWQHRFEITGLHHIELARQAGRPVVLVCLHFGTYKLMPFVLRALGIPVVAMLSGNSRQRSRVKRMKDRLSPFPNLPTVLYRGDQLRQLVEMLTQGCVLLLAADRPRGKQISITLDDDWSFNMATGAIRLASYHDAELVPCSMIDEGRWHFHLRIAKPVPRHLLNGDETVAGEWLLQSFLPSITERPEHSDRYLAECFKQTGGINQSSVRAR